MIKRLLIANRGEIALRIQKTCKKMNIQSVSVYSDVDLDAPHVRNSDKAIHIGESESSKSYLNIKSIIKAALDANVDAIHPGYGFLSENPTFAEQVIKNNINFIGPNPSSIKAMALKSKARKMMADSNVPVVPGFSLEGYSKSQILSKVKNIGFPIIIKASAGGGGRGMKIVRSEKSLFLGIESAKRESKSSFGNDKLIVEKYLENARHVEVQVLGDRHGNFQVLSDRDCSMQRRHQKIIEEAPAPAIDKSTRKEMAKQAINVAKKVSYVGAGTVEFLFYKKKFFFIEMNTRLQVEHPVTEEIYGIDLVEWQIRIANGEKLNIKPISKGHAIEARIYAENPQNGFLPSPGRIEKLFIPSKKNIRIDFGYTEGNKVPPNYDSMLGKVIAKGNDRKQAISNLAGVLKKSHILGIESNLHFVRKIIENPSFKKPDIGTDFIKIHQDKLFPSDYEKKLLIGMAASIFLQKRSKLNIKNSNPWELKDSWRNSGNASEKLFLEVKKEKYNIEINNFEHKNFSYKILNSNDKDYTKISVKSETSKGEYDILHGKSLMTVVVYKKDNVLSIIHEGYSLIVKVLDRFDINFGGESSSGSLDAPVPGKVAKVFVKKGQKVKEGDLLAVIEAMKMEHSIISPFNGRVKSLSVKEGEQIDEGHTISEIEKLN